MKSPGSSYRIESDWAVTLGDGELDGHKQFPKVILGVKFTAGLEVVKPQAQTAAA